MIVVTKAQLLKRVTLIRLHVRNTLVYTGHGGAGIFFAYGVEGSASSAIRLGDGVVESGSCTAETCRPRGSKTGSRAEASTSTGSKAARLAPKTTARGVAAEAARAEAAEPGASRSRSVTPEQTAPARRSRAETGPILITAEQRCLI